MKFDLDAAWKDTVGLLRRNLNLLAVIGGVFFFLPYALLFVALPEMNSFQQAEATGNLDAVMAAVSDLYAGYWWLFLILAVLQGIGLLGMLALMRRRANPTVGEALATGARSVGSYLLAQLLQTIVLVFAIALVMGTLSIAGPAGAVLGAVLAMIAAAYLVVKFSLAAPIIAIEGELNPVRALTRSWRMTKGNGLRIFLFYLLLLVAFIVISSVTSLAFGLVFALGGEQAALIGTAITSGAINAATVVLIACVLAAVHTQIHRLSEGHTVSVPRTHRD